MKKKKVFCVGFHKTGTSSLGVALEALGYSVASFRPFQQMANSDHVELHEVEALALEVAAQHDAAKDSPWPILYEMLDASFPGSKFIHIQRNRDKWIASAVSDFGTHPNAIRQLIYGSSHPGGNEAAWLERYDRHNREVKEYFAGRDADFISLDLDAGEVNWENVCGFLGEPVPNVSWPHANQRFAKSSKKFYYKLAQKLGF
ncbi:MULTISPECIES: sulfotransferase [unclassified Roseovarius]|uniref:sulfotransferase n=1 Tax=unclassified Roseovarius TaxID=2614913 RepID=UPI00273FBB0B|nr:MULTISPECIES: sulfotransferase family protein [unclassified Roseovarius]